MQTWRTRFRGRGMAPSVAIAAEVVTGDRLLAGAERWAGAFRAAGLRPGDRLVTALPTGACLAQVLLAGLWSRLTLVPLPATTDPVVAAAEADPSAAVVAPDAFAGREVPWAWRAEGPDGPPGPLPQRRPAGPPTPVARLLCARSSPGPWVALLDDNLEHAVDAVLSALRPERARWLSVLPWHSPAGLLLDLLPALLGADQIIRPESGDEPTANAVANALQRWHPSHTVLPLTQVRQLRAIWGGLQPLGTLLGGLASGPGLDDELAADLRSTQLRSHRGAPELSCMVTLGEPGIWRPGALGRPVECAIAEGPAGTLMISGRPLAGGTWIDGGLHLVDRLMPVAVALA